MIETRAEVLKARRDTFAYMAFVGFLWGVCTFLGGRAWEQTDVTETGIDEMSFCAYHCEEHGLPTKMIYNGQTREARCLCSDGLELSGVVPTKESSDEYGSSNEDVR